MVDFEKKPDGDTRLPKACIDRIVHNTLQPNISIGKDLRLTLLNYGIAFVQFISIGAYEMCEKEKKKTITPGHIIQALDKFGFGSYVEECESALCRYQSLASRRPSRRNALEVSGLPMDVLLDQQQKMFTEAKEEMDKSVLEEGGSE